ncbi:uncharacterized protein ARMOST_06242 [Armillaria ostoyae]|uniref:Uncharacterized protein n=1 Tax=Armillaria ostoyae TaxID=47428 RepID=A0A284R2E7_ARMOS|nr:uncharacterized protein ARMOST_06242 [Armillaria ostoyae]
MATIPPLTPTLLPLYSMTTMLVPNTAANVANIPPVHIPTHLASSKSPSYKESFISQDLERPWGLSTVCNLQAREGALATNG